MRIVLDAMGSDHAPQVDVAGGVRAARRFGQEVILVGDEKQIQRELSQQDISGLKLQIVHADQVIDMGEHPSEAVRNKPGSSMVVGMKLLRDGKADAFVSAGNSGGVLAAALVSAGRLERIRGVQRPAISTVVPTGKTKTLMLDIGANTDCKPDWLAQFALMGSAYSKVLGVANPKVALLANGEEDTKGNAAVQATHAILRQLPLNFVGNVEGKDIVHGIVDVIVCDGFVGNVALKTAEGVFAMMLELIKTEIKAKPLTSLGGLLAKPAFKAVAKKLDYREYGGAPLLGVNGVVIIAHGRSDAMAIENAVRVAINCVENKLVEGLRADIEASLPLLNQLMQAQP
ncbi:MAG: phosphate acyltransferase PlsX [Anaerolineae bacterium]